MYDWDKQVPFSVLVGKTLTAIENTGDEIKFVCSDGTLYSQYHSQDCCESVSVEDVVGDLNDLIGEPLLEASEEINRENPKDKEWDESFTWTFYKLTTRKANITIRWYGSSNGYYSESVDFYDITKK